MSKADCIDREKACVEVERRKAVGGFLLGLTCVTATCVCVGVPASSLKDLTVAIEAKVRSPCAARI